MLVLAGNRPSRPYSPLRVFTRGVVYSGFDTAATGPTRRPQVGIRWPPATLRRPAQAMGADQPTSPDWDRRTAQKWIGACEQVAPQRCPMRPAESLPQELRFSCHAGAFSTARSTRCDPHSHRRIGAWCAGMHSHRSILMATAGVIFGLTVGGTGFVLASAKKWLHRQSSRSV